MEYLTTLTNQREGRTGQVEVSNYTYQNLADDFNGLLSAIGDYTTSHAKIKELSDRQISRLEIMNTIQSTYENIQLIALRDAPLQSLPHMTSSQAVTFMMVEEHLKHLLPPSLIEEMNPWFDLARRSLSSQNNVRQWINRVRIVPATQPLIPPVVDKAAQQAVYEGLLQDKQLECVYQGRVHNSEEKTYILNPLALVQKGSIIYLVCTRHDKSDIQTFALHRFKSAVVLNSRALHPVNFDIDEYIDSGALGFRVDFNQPTENVTLKLTMSEADAHYLEESQLSKDQKIEKIDKGMALITATVPFTSQLVWWLRSFGKKIKHIEPSIVADAVNQRDEGNP